MKCVGGGGGWRLNRPEGKVCLSAAACLAKECRSRNGNVRSMRIGGVGEGMEREGKKRKAEGSKGFTARSLAFQVMDTLVLV